MHRPGLHLVQLVAKDVTPQVDGTMKYLVDDLIDASARRKSEAGSKYFGGFVDIVLGVSMTPTTVRMVLVEGDKADGVTVDHDVFDIDADGGSATTSAPDQVIAAILGTRESATEGGHHLLSTGVAWRDHAEAAALRDALTARKIEDVLLVSELHAAGALAQAVGRATGYDRTALIFLERDTATLSVVDTADGSIVKVQNQSLHSDDAVAELTGLVAGLETLEAPPQAVFVVGSGVSIGAIKLELDMATSLPVIAPDEPDLALARGAALASAQAPRYEASTVGLAYANDRTGTTAAPLYAADPSRADTQVAGSEYGAAPAALAYSDFPDDDPLELVAPSFEPEPFDPRPAPRETQGRKPFLLVGSALTSIFVIGVTALVISLAVAIRPTVDQRPNPGESAIVPTPAPETIQAPAPMAQVPAPAPAPAPPPETIQAPVPVVKEAPQAAPRTVYVAPPAAKPAVPAADPAPAPAAPAPALPPEAPAPLPPPPVAPYVPPVYVPPAPVYVPPVAPPILRNLIPPFLRPREQYTPPQQQYPQYNPPQRQWPQYTPPQQQYPQYTPPQQQSPQPPQSSDGGYGSGSHDYGRGGSGGNDRGDNGSDGGSDGGSSGGSNGGGPLWPLWPGRN